MTTHTLSSQKSNRQFWAFLIGIDQYPNYRQLEGCVNDVAAISCFLSNQMHVPAEQIVCLTNENATRANILATFQRHLINNPNIQQNDQIFIHFSGHGALMADPQCIEPSGKIESVVPYDSGIDGEFNIPDTTIGALLAQLAHQKGSNITVCLDCCHAGSGTRAPENRSAPRVRFAENDLRTPPPNLDAAFTTTGSADYSRWKERQLPYTLLAACRHNELATEYRSGHGANAITHGALTYFLLENLRQLKPGTRYDELMERICAKVNAIYPQQMPQCEGNRGRAVFDGAQIERDPFILVQKQRGPIVTLGAGLVHGLQKGTEVAIYAADVKTYNALPPQPLATARVNAVRAASADAELIGPAEPIIACELGRALVTSRFHLNDRQHVLIRAERQIGDQAVAAALCAAIQSAGPGRQPSLYLSQVANPEEKVDLKVDLIVYVKQGGISIYGDESKVPLVQPEQLLGNEQHIRNTIYSLESIARYRRIMGLHNNDERSAVQGQLSLKLRRYTANGQANLLPEVTPDAAGNLSLSYDPAQENHWYVIDVTNHAKRPLYPVLFILAPDYSIKLLYPAFGQEKVLMSGQTLHIGYKTIEERLNIYLPGGSPAEARYWKQATDYLKVIATTAPCDLTSFEQGGLNVSPIRAIEQMTPGSALEQLLRSAISEKSLRFQRIVNHSGIDWGTSELAFTIVRKSCD